MATASSDLVPPFSAAQEMLERDLELIPIPAVQVAREGDAFGFLSMNRAYRLAGLGVVADRSPMLALLASRIDAFLRSTEMRTDFDWSIGQVIDSRYYRVTFARPTPALRDRCQISFIDLDRFGRLNACLGGLAGDELLITVARRIKGALRARDVLARIGGDEFGILMGIDDDQAEATWLAERIQRVLTAPFRLSDYEIGIECSVGIAHADESVEDAEELIRNAQFAAKRAKSGLQVESYQTQAFTLAREQFAMETALRRAIEERQLRLAFQPICDLSSGAIVSFEALARWRDPHGVEHDPGAFIPVAEESGLIVPLGRWAIEEAARTLRWWDEECGGSCGMRLAVNLSAIQMQRDDIAPVVEAALIRHDLTGDRLVLELTESAIVSDPDRIAGIMHALKSLGCTLAMDDFGTGYSNLAYLQKLPIDILKIDRSFVTGMLTDRDKIAIVRAVLSLAQALGMRTTAEGIESNDLAQTLAALGCTYGQGYLYARPLEAVDALSTIRAARASSTAASAI